MNLQRPGIFRKRANLTVSMCFKLPRMKAHKHGLAVRSLICINVHQLSPGQRIWVNLNKHHLQVQMFIWVFTFPSLIPNSSTSQVAYKGAESLKQMLLDSQLHSSPARPGNSGQSVPPPSPSRAWHTLYGSSWIHMVLRQLQKWKVIRKMDIQTLPIQRKEINIWVPKECRGSPGSMSHESCNAKHCATDLHRVCRKEGAGSPQWGLERDLHRACRKQGAGSAHWRLEMPFHTPKKSRQKFIS